MTSTASSTSNGACYTIATPPPAGFRKDVENSLKQVEQIFKASTAPLPRYPYPPSNEPSSDTTGVLDDLSKLGIKDVETLIQIVQESVTGVDDDNKFLLENIVRLASKLPSTSKNGSELSNAFINKLWDVLPHPPATSLGAQYKYRAADGSNNNIQAPMLGAAGTPYARSAKPELLQNISLPTASDIFDELMARPTDKFEPHPNGVSSVLFYLATIIIHDIFWTDRSDYSMNLTSSYLDLAPLYGADQAQQDTIRTFKDGKLKPDCFSSKRMLGFPPGVGVMMIMFNRLHNYFVTNLAQINENNRFPKPKEGLSKDDAKKAWERYDNDLFQTGRLITCGLYVNCILKDYVRTILNLNSTSSTWDLDPRVQEGKTIFGSGAPDGVGNQVSAEFNLIYRWHSAISVRDDKWTQDEYNKLFPGQDPANIKIHELLRRLGELEDSLSEDPSKREFANLKRQDDGTFDDDQLVEILAASIDDVAGSFGANRVPQILKSVEILGIEQARRWNLASLNEFRSFFGLTKHESFSDINPDPEVARKLEALYDHPDKVELYPGLVAEKAKPPMSPGSGICLNFTTSRAILSDAVALVRGDRFYTIDYTPKNLTNWGYQEAQYDLNVDQGQVLYKVILRAFPNHFKENSIFAHFPFVIPSKNLEIHQKLGTAYKYDWDPPKRNPALIPVTSYDTIKNILNNQGGFKVTWGPSIQRLVDQPPKQYGTHFCLAGDQSINTQSRRLLKTAIFPSQWYQEVTGFYKDTTLRLLKQNSWKMASGSSQVDIVRDVINLAHTEFSASIFSLPLKTAESPHGIYSAQELYTVLTILFINIFYDADVTKSFALRQAGRQLAQQLGELVQLNVESIAKQGFIADILAKFHQHTELSQYGTHMIQRLLASGMGAKEVVWSQILPAAVAGVANQGQLISQVIDFYLGDGVKYLPDLQKLALEDTKEADDKILRYFLEASRIRNTVGLYRTSSIATSIPSSTGPQKIQAGRTLFLNLVAASNDPTVFPNPTEVDLTRPLDSYIHYGWGPHQCLGEDINKVAGMTMLKTIVGLKNLRRATGAQGEMKSVDIGEGLKMYLTSDWSSLFPFPTGMKVRWDE